MRALVLFTISASLIGCALLGGDEAASRARKLRSFLGTPHESRLTSALSRADTRYLAIGGAPPSAPCAPEKWRIPSRHSLIPGTGELDFEDQGQLKIEARDYACAYNTDLAAMLGETPP